MSGANYIRPAKFESQHGLLNSIMHVTAGIYFITIGPAYNATVTKSLPF